MCVTSKNECEIYDLSKRAHTHTHTHTHTHIYIYIERERERNYIYLYVICNKKYLIVFSASIYITPLLIALNFLEKHILTTNE